jgi:hypothetical protein
MTLFAPDICKIGDGDVPVLCPSCGFESLCPGLSGSEKQYLVDSTSYHGMVTEFRLLIAMKAITDRYPGTTNPLLANKLPQPRHGVTDEDHVGTLLACQPELCEMLRGSSFSLDGRFQFVRESIERERSMIDKLLVSCHQCDRQYLVFPQDYYLTIG